MQSGEPLRGGRLPACALDSQNTRFVVRLERQKAREQRRRRASGCNAGAYLQKKSAEAGVAGRCFFCHGFRIDIAGRLGGEEFAILLPATSAASAQEVAERLRAGIAAHSMALPENVMLRFTVSIGCAHSTQAPLQIESLLKLADQHLYQAKNSGRNCVVA